MKKKIKTQFLTVSAIAVIITASISMLLFYNIFKKQVFEDIKAYSHAIQSLGQPFWTLKPYQAHLVQDGIRITLIRADGSVAFDSSADNQTMENHKDRREIKAAFQYGDGTAIRLSSTSSLHTLYYARRLENNMVLRVGKDSGNIYQILTHTVCLVAALSLFILFFCSILSHFLARRLLSPLETLAANPDRASPDDIYEEIIPFLQTIQQQHADILKHAKMRQEFTANVSHELKTPLTAISGYAELIGSGMASGQDTQRFAMEIHANSIYLLTLINDILKLSELDATEIELDFEQVDLYQAAQGCLDMMELEASKKDICLQLCGEPCLVTADKSLMDDLLYNLCSNALRYNRCGGSVTVTVTSTCGRTLLSVKDTGIGIPKKHQQRIFERFYRVDKSRSRQSGGTGLGLAIVKHIVTQHHAELTLKSEPGEGTEIQILF